MGKTQVGKTRSRGEGRTGTAAGWLGVALLVGGLWGAPAAVAGPGTASEAAALAKIGPQVQAALEGEGAARVLVTFFGSGQPAGSSGARASGVEPPILDVPDDLLAAAVVLPAPRQVQELLREATGSRVESFLDQALDPSGGRDFRLFARWRS